MSTKQTSKQLMKELKPAAAVIIGQVASRQLNGIAAPQLSRFGGMAEKLGRILVPAIGAGVTVTFTKKSTLGASLALGMLTTSILEATKTLLPAVPGGDMVDDYLGNNLKYDTGFVGGHDQLHDLPALPAPVQTYSNDRSTSGSGFIADSDFNEPKIENGVVMV